MPPKKGFAGFAGGLAQGTQNIPQILLALRNFQEQEKREKQRQKERSEDIRREQQQEVARRGERTRERAFITKRDEAGLSERLGQRLEAVGRRGFRPDQLRDLEGAATKTTDLSIPIPGGAFGLGGTAQAQAQTADPQGLSSAILGLGQSPQEKQVFEQQSRLTEAQISSAEARALEAQRGPQEVLGQQYLQQLRSRNQIESQNTGLVSENTNALRSVGDTIRAANLSGFGDPFDTKEEVFGLLGGQPTTIITGMQSEWIRKLTQQGVPAEQAALEWPAHVSREILDLAGAGLPEGVITDLLEALEAHIPPAPPVEVEPTSGGVRGGLETLFNTPTNPFNTLLQTVFTKPKGG